MEVTHCWYQADPSTGFAVFGTKFSELMSGMNDLHCRMAQSILPYRMRLSSCEPVCSSPTTRRRLLDLKLCSGPGKCSIPYFRDILLSSVLDFLSEVREGLQKLRLEAHVDA